MTAGVLGYFMHTRVYSKSVVNITTTMQPTSKIRNTYEIICTYLPSHWRQAKVENQHRNRKQLHCKRKVSEIPVPSRDVTYRTLIGREKFKLFPARESLFTYRTLFGREKFKLFPARESLVSDTPSGDRKIVNLFYSVQTSQKETRLLAEI